MAVAGLGTRLFVDKWELTGFTQSVDTNIQTELLDTSTLDNTVTSYVTGLTTATLAVEGLYDPSLPNWDAVLSDNEFWVTRMQPDTHDIGDIVQVANCILGKNTQTSGTSEAVRTSMEFQTTADTFRSLKRSWLLYDQTDDMATGSAFAVSGSSVDLGAPDTAGDPKYEDVRWTIVAHILNQNEDEVGYAAGNNRMLLQHSLDDSTFATLGTLNFELDDEGRYSGSLVTTADVDINQYVRITRRAGTPTTGANSRMIVSLAIDSN